jgi:hypothetical protein
MARDGSDGKDEGAGEAQGQAVRLQIKAADDVARGVFANLALMHHNDAEFILDFVFVEPQRPVGQVVSRVVMTPRSTKRLLVGLQEIVRRFEERFGQIPLPEPAPKTTGNYH